MARIIAGGVECGIDSGRHLWPRTPIVIGIYDNVARIVGITPPFPPHLHCALGIDPSKELYTSDERPVPITDGGRPVSELFA